MQSEAENLADKPTLATRNRGLVMLGIILITLCQFFDSTIANVALPHMRTSLDANSDTISWVLTSYIIATAIFMPITGWLSDRVGSRNLFLAASAGFLLTSALCGMATSLTSMVIFRSLQGVCSAFIGPMTQTCLFDISPPSKQPMAMAIFAMIVMIAPITGPALGGLITENLNWRWIFYINLPIGIPAILILWWGLPSRPIKSRALDKFGFFSLAVGLGAMQLVLDRGQHVDWFNSWEIIIETIVAVSALWMFFVHLRSAPNPLFPKELLSSKQFLIGFLVMTAMGLAMVALSGVLPTMFQTLYHYSVVDSGLMMAPRGFGVLVASFAFGRLAMRIDPRFAVATGYALLAYSMWLMSHWALEMEQSVIYGTLLIQGIGMGMIIPPINMVAFMTLPPALRPDGSSLLSLARSIGGSIGISVIIATLARTQQEAHVAVGANITAQSIPSFDWVSTLNRLGPYGDAVMGMVEGEVLRQAAMISFIINFQAMMWMFIAFIPLALLLKRQATQ